MLIDRDAKLIRNEPVYKRIGCRKPVITCYQLGQSGDREPDPAIYDYDPMMAAWYLKEGF